MIYLLDSNTCISYINGRSPIIIAKFSTVPVADIAVCSVVKAELYFGSKKSGRTAPNLARQQAFLQRFVSLPFDDLAADIYADIRARLEKLGTPIGSNDYLIASIALAHKLILVTHNTREFSRITGLHLEDWES